MSQDTYPEIPEEFDFNIQQELVLDLELESTQSHSSTEKLFDQKQRIFISETSTLKLFSDIGMRSKNLDKFDYYLQENFQAYGLFDGHGDSSVSVFLQKNLLKKIVTHRLFFSDTTKALFDTFAQFEEEFSSVPNYERNGSTALVVIFLDGKIYVANLGDCVAFGVDMTEKLMVLSEEHNFCNEKQIKSVSQKGGILIKKGKSYRLNGEMSLSRSFGDLRFKKLGFISAIPEVMVYEKSKFTRIILASDGFFNYLGNIVKDMELVRLIDRIQQNKGKLEINYFEDNATFIDIKSSP